MLILKQLSLSGLMPIALDIHLPLITALYRFSQNAFLSFKSYYVADAHKFQLRVYIYQARDLRPSDPDGFSGKEN